MKTSFIMGGPLAPSTFIFYMDNLISIQSPASQLTIEYNFPYWIMTVEGARGPPIKRDVFLAPSWTDLETQESTESRTPEASFMFPPFLSRVPTLKLSFEKIKSPDGLRNVHSPLSNLKRILLFLPREPTFGFHYEHWKDSSSQELSNEPSNVHIRQNLQKK